MILQMATDLNTGERRWVLNGQEDRVFSTVEIAGLATLYKGKLPEVFANTEIATLHNTPAWQSEV